MSDERRPGLHAAVGAALTERLKAAADRQAEIDRQLFGAQNDQLDRLADAVEENPIVADTLTPADRQRLAAHVTRRIVEREDRATSSGDAS